ncbi:MAG: cysteine desulfurase family protein [Alphaproteobacteria bacterium]
MSRDIYLDYNATAPLRPEALAAIAAALAETGNASSVHSFGRRARKHVEDAREAVAALTGAAPAAVVFTSGGTEANNLALAGAGRERLLVSDIEHDSILAAAPAAERIPVGPDGVVRLDALAALLQADRRPALVAVMLANNETGVVQPLAELARLAHAHGALVHADAVQAAGKIRIDFAALGADLMALSAHKLGGPQGVGALLVRDGLAIASQLRGGGQERGLRAGTENVAGIAGFGAAAAAAHEGLPGYALLAALRGRLEQGIAALSRATRFFGREAPRLANTSCFTMPGVASETQLIALDLAGIGVSAGSACSSGKVRPSHVLRAMGASEAEASSAIRVSLGWLTLPEEIERFIEAWGAVYNRLVPAGRVSRHVARSLQAGTIL